MVAQCRGEKKQTCPATPDMCGMAPTSLHDCVDLQRWQDSERAKLLACEMTVMCVLNFPDSQRHPFGTACAAMSALGMQDFTSPPVNAFSFLMMQSINRR